MAHPLADNRSTLELPPKITLDTLAERSGVPVDTLRTYLYRGRGAPAPTRRRIAAALRAYALEVEATAARIEADPGRTPSPLSERRGRG